MNQTHYQVAWLHYQVARLPDCNAFNFYPISLLKVNKGPVINYREGKVQHRLGGKLSYTPKEMGDGNSFSNTDMWGTQRF